jgi:hypothetical protein
MADVTIAGDRAANLDLCLALMALIAARDLLPATPTVTRDLGLYYLIRKTSTHVLLWDSNPRDKDCLANLTTASHRGL